MKSWENECLDDNDNVDDHRDDSIIWRAYSYDTTSEIRDIPFR